jgi:CheY-like chemotaxis protein
VIELSAMALVENPAAQSVILKVLQDNNIEPDFCDSDQSGLEHLKQRKFDLVVLDSDICNASEMVQAVRTSASSSKALVFAITKSPEQLRASAGCGGFFALRKPLREGDISSLIRAGYGTMLRERRQYFRCSAATPIQIEVGSDLLVLGRSLNISSGGMAIESEFPMRAGVNVKVSFALPGGRARIEARAQVVWADQRGKAGFRFVDSPPEMQRILNDWLNEKFEAQLQADDGNLAGLPVLVPAS